jgi:hypothetical protein
MGNFRDKITPFTFGLSIGLLAACLFFIFKLDTYIRKIDLTNLAPRKNVSEEVVAAPEKKPAETKKAEKPLRKGEGSGEKNNFAPVVSVNNVNDSAYTESETFRVLKEELQSVKNIYVKVLAQPEKSRKDSLLASLAGVSTPDDKEFFMIEFWKTPLNSKGYKMTRSRLLIYGFNEGKDLQLVKDADKYYLKNNNIIYSLSYSAEFRPLERAPEAEAQGKF